MPIQGQASSCSQAAAGRGEQAGLEEPASREADVEGPGRRAMYLCSLRKIGPAFRCSTGRLRTRRALKFGDLRTYHWAARRTFNRMGKGRDRSLV